MSDARTFLSGAYGAFLLGRFDRRGLDFIPHDPQAAWHSLWLYILAIPLQLLTIAMSGGIGAPSAPDQANLATTLLSDGLMIFAAHLAYLLLAQQLLGLLGLSDRFAAFVAFNNWTGCLSALVYTLAFFIGRGGEAMLPARDIPYRLDEFLALSAMLWAASYELYALYRFVDSSALRAVLFISLSFFVHYAFLLLGTIG
jgi:hypothetical protein